MIQVLLNFCEGDMHYYTDSADGENPSTTPKPTTNVGSLMAPYSWISKYWSTYYNIEMGMVPSIIDVWGYDREFCSSSPYRALVSQLFGIRRLSAIRKQKMYCVYAVARLVRYTEKVRYWEGPLSEVPLYTHCTIACMLSLPSPSLSSSSSFPSRVTQKRNEKH